MLELEEFAGGQVFDQAAIGGEELIFGEFFEFHPLELVEDFVFEFSLERGYRVKLKINGAAVAIVVADMGDMGTYGCANAQFLFEFARECLLGAFTLLDLAARKLPLQGHGLVGTPLADEDPTFANEQSCDNETKCRSGRSRVGEGLRFFHDPSVNGQ